MESTNKLKLFKEGINLIFKKWSGFRLALDYNPKILETFTEEGELEINEMIELLIDDIIDEIVNIIFNFR
jgi:hypothetical protein